MSEVFRIHDGMGGPDRCPLQAEQGPPGSHEVSHHPTQDCHQVKLFYAIFQSSLVRLLYLDHNVRYSVATCVSGS